MAEVISGKIALRWLSLDLTDDKSTLVQVIAIRQLAITWTNVDPDLFCHVPSLGHNGWTLNSRDYNLNFHSFTESFHHYLITIISFVQAQTGLSCPIFTGQVAIIFYLKKQMHLNFLSFSLNGEIAQAIEFLWNLLVKYKDLFMWTHIQF